MDFYFNKSFERSPYSSGNNSPIYSFDMGGDSLYVLFYAIGNDKPVDDNMFYAMALTRRANIEREPFFDPCRDNVVVIGFNKVSDIKNEIKKVNSIYRKSFGNIVEVGVWSHSGVDGPLAYQRSTIDPVDGYQMGLKGWESIEFDWENGGQGCRLNFYGCNSGLNYERLPSGYLKANPEGQSFATRVSSGKNVKNVIVAGQLKSSYPSKYVNVRENSDPGNGEFFKGERGQMLYFYPTYLVGADKKAFFNRDVAYPMQRSKNGKVLDAKFQTGNEKK